MTNVIPLSSAKKKKHVIVIYVVADLAFLWTAIKAFILRRRMQIVRAYEENPFE